MKSLFLIFACVSAALAQSEAPITQKGWLLDFNSDILNVFAEQIDAFRDIHQGLKDKKSPVTIIQEVVSKYPNSIKGLTWFTAVCQLPAIQKIFFVGSSCKFIDDNADAFIERITGQKSTAAPTQKSLPTEGNATQRWLIGDIIGDQLNVFKEQVAALKDINDGVKNKKPVKDIIRDVVGNHTELVKGLVWFTAPCQLPAIQKIIFIGTACKFIDDNADAFLTYISGVKPPTKEQIQEAITGAKDKVESAAAGAKEKVEAAVAAAKEEATKLTGTAAPKAF